MSSGRSKDKGHDTSVPSSPAPLDEELEESVLNGVETSEKISWLLDECIRIPGTNIRFGLDPVIGLIPYGGETVGAVIGSIILAVAGRRRLPLRTLVRMGGNILVNAGVGTIPIVGDAFSFWFKSNKRNYALLRAYLAQSDGTEPKGGWGSVIFIAFVCLVVLALNVLSWFLLGTLVYQGWKALTTLIG